MKEYVAIGIGALAGAVGGALIMRVIDKGGFKAAFSSSADSAASSQALPTSASTSDNVIVSSSDTIAPPVATVAIAPSQATIQPALEAPSQAAIPSGSSSPSAPSTAMLASPSRSLPVRPAPSASTAASMSASSTYLKLLTTPGMYCSDWMSLTQDKKYTAVQKALYPGVPADQNTFEQQRLIWNQVNTNNSACG